MTGLAPPQRSQPTPLCIFPRASVILCSCQSLHHIHASPCTPRSYLCRHTTVSSWSSLALCRRLSHIHIRLRLVIRAGPSFTNHRSSSSTSLHTSFSIWARSYLWLLLQFLSFSLHRPHIPSPLILLQFASYPQEHVRSIIP